MTQLVLPLLALSLLLASACGSAGAQASALGGAGGAGAQASALGGAGAQASALGGAGGDAATRGGDAGRAGGGIGSTAHAGTGDDGAGAAGRSQATGGGGAGGAGAAAVSYTTGFDLTESPISERGAWTNVGLDWTSVVTGAGRAYGTHSGSAFNDSYAHLSGFPSDVEVSTVIYLDPTLSSNYHEVEIWLRAADSAHNARGYECNLNYAGGYAEVVRWNGDLGSFTYIGGGQGAGGGHQPKNGSVFKARIQGRIITTYLDGAPLQTVDISSVASGAVWTDGNPGLGFYNGDAGKYGFQSYSALAL